MSIILVRHSATALNIARVLQPPDTPLCEEGRAQATAVARELAGLRPAALLSSDYARARQTAETISQACSLPVAVSELLRERNFGELSGRPYDGLGFDPLVMTQAPPGGESAADFERRVGLAFDDLCIRRAVLGGPLVVVTHGLVIRAMLAGPVALSPERLRTLHVGNTAITILAPQAPHRVDLLVSTRHLDARTRDDPNALVGG